MRLNQLYPAFGRNAIGEEISRWPILVFDAKASEEAPHAVHNPQEKNPDYLSITKHLSDFKSSHAD